MIRKSIFIFLFFFWLNCKATFFPAAMGPYSLGMAGITASKNDPYAAFNHPAFLAFSEKRSMSISIQSRYFMEGLNYMGIAGNYKLKKLGVFGVGCGSIGNKHYNESLIKLTLSKKLNPKLTIGISTNYFRLQIPENQKKVMHKSMIELGAFYQFNNRLYFAVKLFNPGRTKLSTYLDERFPFLINTSCFFAFNEHLNLAAEWEQTMGASGMDRFGVEYKWKQGTLFNAGIFGKPFNPGCGVSLDRKNLKIQLSFVYHPYLGINSGIGITAIHLVKPE